MNRTNNSDRAGRIELTPESLQTAELIMSATHRAVLRPSGKTFDAAAATRAEREAQAGERAKGKT